MTLKPAPPPDPHLVALRLLNYRFRSVAELENRLREKGFDEIEIADEVARLKAERWLDDARFAREYALSRLRKRFGRRRIERELRDFGVDDSLIREALTEALGDHPEEANLTALVEKRAKSLTGRYGADYLDSEPGRKKLVTYLLSQGYDPAAVFGELDRRRRSRRN